jgi:hypothetical protein
LNLICAIDVNAKALATYQHNYPKTRTFQEDIRKVNPSELRLYLGLQREELTALIDGLTLSRIFTKYPRLGIAILMILAIIYISLS